MTRIKNNDTFGIEDEWYLMFGPQITSDEAKDFTLLQWKLAKKEIKAARAEMDQEEKGGIFWQQAKSKYTGLLWKYQEVIKKFKVY